MKLDLGKSRALFIFSIYFLSKLKKKRENMFINKNGQREHKSHLFFDENKSDARCLRFETNIKKN